MNGAPNHRSRSAGSAEPSRFPPIVSLANVSEDELWDLLLADAAAEAQAGRIVELERYLRGVPGIRGNPQALHAAIAATLENARRLGEDGGGLLERMRDEHPDLAERIDEVELVEGLVGEEERRPGGPETRSLPCEYGPESWSGERRYVLHELLGVGTRGSVYKALDQTMSSADKPVWVAIKIVPEWTGMRADEVLAEARRAKRVDHESVARVLDAGVHDDNECFIVCEFVDGITLADARESEPGGLGARGAVRMLVPVIEAMADAHAGGLAHLDIHPRNILVDRDRRARLIDFGLGVTNFEAWRPARRPLGSLGFMAPEIYQRDPEPSLARADVYSFAGLLLWLATGRIPNGQTIEETEFRLSRDADQGETLAPDAFGSLDRDLAAILRRALARNPADRYESARGLAADLRTWLERRPLPWTRPSPARRFLLLARRSPGALAAGVAILVLAVGATAAITAQRVSHAADMRVAEARRAEEVARLEAERLAERAEIADRMEAFGSAVRGFVLSRDIRRTAGRDWIVLLTLVRDLTEAGMQLDSEVLGSMRSQRVEIARARAAEAAERYGESDIQALLWRAALAAWLMDSKRYDEAAAEIDAAMPLLERGGNAAASLHADLAALGRAAEALGEPDPRRGAARARDVLEHPDRDLLPGSVLGALEARVADTPAADEE